MQTTFFATEPDLSLIWNWLFEVPGMRVCEDYSRPDQANRWFNTWEDLDRAFDGNALHLAAWSTDFGISPQQEIITFRPNTQKELGGKGRTVLRSPAFIKVARNNEQNGCLASASITCWNEKGARARSIFTPEILDRTDWKKLAAASSLISRRIKKVSPARMRSYPIMPDAWRRFKGGEMKFWNWGAECIYPSDLVIE